MRALYVGIVLLLALAPLVRAEEEAPARRVVIVLDRGSAAQETRRTDANNAMRLWKSLAARGVDCSLLAAGVDGDGSTVVRDVPPTEIGLKGLSRRPIFDFRGPTDPRAALAQVFVGAADEARGPIDLILLGPFAPAGSGGESGLELGVKRWNDDAPAGSRVLAVRTHEDGRGLLAEARGLVTEGRLVIGFGKPDVDTQPYSPFGAGHETIDARVRVLVDVLSLHVDVKHGALLTATSDVKGDAVTVETTAGLHTIALRRRPGDGRTATLSFDRGAATEDVQWLVEPPRPLTFRWDTLAKEARLVGAKGQPAGPFAAIDVEVGTPQQTVLRLLRTRTGPAPAWRARAAEGDLPPGLTVTVGPEVKTSPEVGEAEVRLVFEARPGRPIAAQGTILIEADGVETPVRLAYEVRVRPGAVALEGVAAPAALPRSAKEARTTLQLVSRNANAPGALQLRAVCDGGQEQWLRALVLTPSGGVTRWNLSEPFLLDVGEARELAFELDPAVPPELVWPCTVTINPIAINGVEIEGELTVTVRKRRPRLELGGPPPAFTLEEGTLRSDTPFVLQLDADGGDGDYLLGLIKTAPSLRSRGGSIGWQAVNRGQGVWHIVPSGEWTGTQASIFRDQEEHVDLEIEWSQGRTPGTVQIPVAVPARWGKRGFVLVSLAAMALLLALLVLGYMRTPPVKGVLLYTVDGLDGTVGRLDLAAVGRKFRMILTDDKGKLSIGKNGAAIAGVRPTRVGGMLEYLDVSGSKERRLLVDGVSLRLGRHLVRYVYGRRHDDVVLPTGAPGDDLLGPEFDIEGGKIDALEADTTGDDPVEGNAPTR